VVDLQPDDKRLSGHQQVQALVSIPGLIAVAKTGAVAALGWMGGDPIKSRLMPLWEIGQGAVTAAAKLVFNADQVQLGGDSGDAVATKKDLQVLYNAINSAGVTAGDGGATLKANIITALGTALWSSGASDGHFCSSTTNAKR
jgi:hypothetical protein